MAEPDETIAALHETVDNVAAARWTLEAQNERLRRQLLQVGAREAPWWALPLVLFTLTVLALLLYHP